MLQGVNVDSRPHLELLLLSALRSGPAHGYAIIERLRDRSGGVFDLAEGSVYPALHRLERAGMLESEWADETGRRRRTYRLTAKGGRVLAQRADDWRRFSRGMTAALGGVG